MFNYVTGRHSGTKSKFGNKLQDKNKIKTTKKATGERYCKKCGKREIPTVQDYSYTDDFFIRTYFCKRCGWQIRLEYLPVKIYHMKKGKRVGVRP